MFRWFFCNERKKENQTSLSVSFSNTFPLANPLFYDNLGFDLYLTNCVLTKLVYAYAQIFEDCSLNRSCSDLGPFLYRVLGIEIKKYYSNIFCFKRVYG